jgi:hypothetical protein
VICLLMAQKRSARLDELGPEALSAMLDVWHFIPTPTVKWQV